MSPSVLRGLAVAGEAQPLPVAPPPVPAGPAAEEQADRPEDVLAAARAEAEAIVAAARAEAEGIREEARAEGFATGRQAALDQAAAAVDALEALTDALERRARERDEEAAREAALLAVEIAAKLLRAELSVAPERVVDVLRGAIRRASDRSRLVARVHPDDLAVCRDAAPGIIERMGGIDRLQVVDDPRITRGSCVLETAGGDVDATFESQLARVLDALRAPLDPDLLDEDAPGA